MKKKKKIYHIELNLVLRDDLSYLIHHRLEARDRKNVHLIAPASIREVNGNSVLVHFDGWSDNFNYWADINDLDFRPVGWAEYRKEQTAHRTTEDDYKNIKFDPPKDYYKNNAKMFTWEDYLKENDLKAVPFDTFTQY
ncbi:lethal(3)malignant brain tumor 4 isoform X2 [Brachionus plicatilis]|uniref:Lethal(3)malignant brain tumor 4 isoform X2 n=1 Tax=Brachionus plicatilis TaxID=10195 RepID=A0A3M7S7I8_BRAPC|nr:lethal(3)malignant brain tumor 4 isoform X2 [Brachionus plicatilis]